MKTLWIPMVGVCLTVGNLKADIIHVPGDYPTIQIAIQQSQPADIVMVAPGTYYEAIAFLGNAITVQSENPNDPDIVIATIIDALSMGVVVTFDGTEDEYSVLSGLTITGGTKGIDGNRASPTIQKCVITENSSYGIYDTEGIIEDCTISDNGSYGIYNAAGTIIRCVVLSNSNSGIMTGRILSVQSSQIIGNAGDGVKSSQPIQIVKCTISNSAGWGIRDLPGGSSIRQTRIIENGGGMSQINGLVENSIIARNGSHGLQSCGADVLSCTITENDGYGFQSHSGTISHCIIWNNEDGELSGSTTPIWSTTFDPFFVFSEDYHLAADSLCIDLGDPDYPDDPSNPQFDADGNERVQGDRIDIGAYEFITDCIGDDFDQDGVPDNCDFDMDNDGVWNTPDVCDFTPLGMAVHTDGRPLSDLTLDCLINLRDFAAFQNDFGL